MYTPHKGEVAEIPIGSHLNRVRATLEKERNSLRTLAQKSKGLTGKFLEFEAALKSFAEIEKRVREL